MCAQAFVREEMLSSLAAINSPPLAKAVKTTCSPAKLAGWKVRSHLLPADREAVCRTRLARICRS